MIKCNTRLTFIALILLCCLCGTGLVMKYLCIDVESHYRNGTCTIQNCTFIEKSPCLYFRSGYICYKTYVKYTLNNTNFTKEEVLNLSYQFPCNITNIKCYYSDTNIEKTLSLSEPETLCMIFIMLLCILSLVAFAHLIYNIFSSDVYQYKNIDNDII